MAKKSNVFSQGQGGANFEFRVQTAFVILMLIEGKFPCLPEDAKATFIKFQASGKGYNFLTDDIYLEYKTPNNDVNKLLIQVKHNLSFSTKNSIFKETIKNAWIDFNAKNFNPSFDRIAIIKGNLTNNEYNNLIQVLDWAKYKISDADFYNEIKPIKTKKNVISVFKETLQIANNGIEVPLITLWKFLKCLWVSSYDFNNESSKDEAHILTILKKYIPQNSSLSAKDIWNRVFEYVSKADSKGASINYSSLPSYIKDCFSTSNKISFFVHHLNSPPLSFDYFYQNDKLIKSYTESECRFKIIIENKSSSVLTLDKFFVKTLLFNKTQSRILRLNSVQGIFKPEKFKFNPIPLKDSKVNLLSEDDIFVVAPNSEEIIIFELDKPNVTKGFYNLCFIIKGHHKNEKIEFFSEKIPLSINSKTDNKISLETMKFFEDPIPHILKLENLKWNKIKSISKKDKYLLYLGQTIHEKPEDIPMGSDWKIKGLRKLDKTSDGFSVDPKKSPKIIMNLNIPISEPLYELSLPLKSYLEIDSKLSKKGLSSFQRKLKEIESSKKD